MDSEFLTCLLKFIEYFPDYLSALSSTLVRFFWTTIVETAVYIMMRTLSFGHFEVEQGTGSSCKFYPIYKLTLPHEGPSKQVMGLGTWFQIHTNLSNFEMASPKIIQTLKILVTSVIYLKIDENRNFQFNVFEIVANR